MPPLDDASPVDVAPEVIAAEATSPDGNQCRLGLTCGCNAGGDCNSSPNGNQCKPGGTCGCNVDGDCDNSPYGTKCLSGGVCGCQGNGDCDKGTCINGRCG
jgi:hypothetical protein